MFVTLSRSNEEYTTLKSIQFRAFRIYHSSSENAGSLSPQREWFVERILSIELSCSQSQTDSAHSHHLFAFAIKNGKKLFTFGDTLLITINPQSLPKPGSMIHSCTSHSQTSFQRFIKLTKQESILTSAILLYYLLIVIFNNRFEIIET